MMNYLPQKLTKLRKHYNYSQSNLADYLDVDVFEYMGYENGNCIINYAQMKRLASLYHISMLDMFKNSDDVPLYDTGLANTDEINLDYFLPKRNIITRIKNFVYNHKIASTIIGLLVIAIIVLSIVLRNSYKPYTISKENINSLSASETTVIYINDSGALGFSGSNSNGQLNDLATTNAVKVAEGDGFSIVLNSDGTITSSGLTSELDEEIQSWKNITDIACGSNHVLGLDSNGRVNCSGESEPCQIDGTKKVKKVFATKNGSILLQEDGSLTYSGNFIGSSSLSGLYNVLDIASSDNIFAVLNSKNKINVYAKSGTYLISESWDEIVDVACGNDFVAGLDQYGKVHIEIENDEIKKQVEAWSNIKAIASGSDYLVAFDGYNVYGVGNNRYNQFIKEEKKKITLEKVSNIVCTVSSDHIDVSFDGVRNASGYIVSVNVLTGLSKRVETDSLVSFSSENMIEGKTYTISIVSVGENNYADSDEANLMFVYNKPEQEILEGSIE